jgi:hypothetical protein
MEVENACAYESFDSKGVGNNQGINDILRA